MIKSYLTSLNNLLLTFNILTITILLLFFITGIILIFFAIIGILDATYRPNIPQYPFNIFFDRICPFIFIITPSFLIYWVNPDKIFSLKIFLFIIIIHSFITVPVIYFWAINRNWLINSQDKYYFDSPLLFFHLALGLIYPAFWGIFLSLNRYFNLSLTINLYDFIDLNVYNTVLPFMIPLMFYLQFYKHIFKFIKYCQTILWKSFCNICHICHLILLKYNFYFFICEKFYKISFVIGNFIVISPDIYPQNKTYNKLRYLLRYLYLKPYIFMYIILFEFIFEIIISKGKIHYSFILIFFFLIFRLFFKFCLLFFNAKFIDEVCLVDYLNKKWEKPRYPSYFWSTFEEHSFLHEWVFDQEDLNLIKNKKIIKPYKFRPTLMTRVQGLGHIYRIKAAYRTHAGVRWVHTSRTIHNLTPLFMRSFLERASFLNLPQGWQHYHNIIVYLDSKGFGTEPLPPDFYNHNQVNISSTNNFQKLIEHNLITNFVPLTKEKVIVKTYDSSIRLDSKGQKCPDAIFDFSNFDKNQKTRIIAMDQKSDPSGKTMANNILSNVTKENYSDGMRRYLVSLHHQAVTNINNMGELKLAFDKIREGTQLLDRTSDNLEEHQLVWAKYMEYFPNNYIPALRVPSNFCTADLNPKFKEKIPSIHERIERISDYLYKKRINELNKGNLGRDALPQQALELFHDSYIQQLLAQE